MIFGLDRLQYVLDCYVSYFNEHRPHQGIGNRIPGEHNMTVKRQGGSMSSNTTARNVTNLNFG
ncbi:MAG: hypothetical protein DRP56_00960 [Planctomycetota bacterium]|nr:MAG: hypothetical protein DRP56_00960 [Planctomycetota bacterium]